MKTVKYRLDIDYYSKDYDNRMMGVSSPIYTLANGMNRYKAAIREKCIDNADEPARVHLWKYDERAYDANGYYIGEYITLAKNY